MIDFTVFKRLFEVNILHGFHLDHWYLAEGTPLPFQEYTSKEQDFIIEHKYNILNDLIIEPTPETRKLLQSPSMRWLRLKSGILVGLEVEKTGMNNNTRFFPKISLPPETKLTFLLRIQNPYFFNFTNHALRPTLPSRYYFTNLDAEKDGKEFPSLSVRLPGFSGHRTWEMGELVQIDGQVRAANKTTRLSGDFVPINGNWYRWAHTGDRTALPKSFTYRFDAQFNAGNRVTNAEFILRKENGEEVKKVTAQYANNIPTPEEALLDFRFLPSPPNAGDEEKFHPKPIPDGWYRLQITINNLFFEERRIMLRSDLPDDNAVFGLIEIGFGATTIPFQLLNANDGSLRLTQAQGSGGNINWRPPVFEVRLMSRATYWQYQIEKPAAGSLPPNDTDFDLVKYLAVPKRIVTKGPRRLSLARTPVQVDTPTGNVFLPNPDQLDLKYSQNQYFSELFLSTIKLS